MSHTARERYSEIVLARMRRDAVLKDGVVFNNDYEGTPTAGAVKIPVRDTEVAVSDYDKASQAGYSPGFCFMLQFSIRVLKQLVTLGRSLCLLFLLCEARERLRTLVPQ